MPIHIQNSSEHPSLWQLQEAKAKLSELLKKAIQKGPQTISIRGVPEAVVLSKKDYDSLTQSKQNLWQFFRDSPLVGCDLKLERDKSAPGDINL